MHKIKTDEIAISNAIIAKDLPTLKAFKIMSGYFYMYDTLHNTNHLKNIKKLYLERKNENLIKISNSLYVEDRSLTRYRKKYLKCFKICKFLVDRFGSLVDFLNTIT